MCGQANTSNARSTGSTYPTFPHEANDALERCARYKCVAVAFAEKPGLVFEQLYYDSSITIISVEEDIKDYVTDQAMVATFQTKGTHHDRLQQYQRAHERKTRLT